MNRHKLLQQMIGVALVMLFLFGCGVPAAAPTHTPIVTVATPQPTATLAPPASTQSPPAPTPSVVGLGDTVLAGYWKVTAAQVSKEPSIRTEYGSMNPAPGGIMLAVRLKLENTASTPSTLELDLSNCSAYGDISVS